MFERFSRFANAKTFVSVPYGINLLYRCLSSVGAVSVFRQDKRFLCVRAAVGLVVSHGDAEERSLKLHRVSRNGLSLLCEGLQYVEEPSLLHETLLYLEEPSLSPV